MKNLIKTLLAVALALAVVGASFIGYAPRDVYDAAMTAMKNGDFDMARSHLERLEDNPEAQQLLSEFYFVPDKVTTTHPNGTYMVQNYAYNRIGCLIKSEVTNNGFISTTTNYNYTEDGRMLTMDLLMGEELRASTTAECFYDDQGRLTCSRIEGNEGLFRQTTYTYDAAGLCIETYYVNGLGDWRRTQYTYDQNGRVQSEQVTTEKADESYLMRYEYYEDGTVKVERLTGPKGLTTRTYRQDGLLTTEMTTDKEGKITSEIYTYNEQNQLVKITYHTGAGITYRYDQQGRLVEELETGVDGKQRKVTQEYNAKGLVSKRVVEDAQGASYTETFKYNKKGLCVTYVYTDAATGQAKTYTYEYDRHGNVEKEICTAATGGYERSYMWTSRHYPDGVPTMIQDLLDEHKITAQP